MSVFSGVDWGAVRDHYNNRVNTHERLLHLHDGKLVEPFFRLALGIENTSGNYSAAEHGLGPKVARGNMNAYDRVFKLAAELRELTDGRSVPDTVRAAGLAYLKVGVGSELSCMVNPTICWVTNTRTIWTHLVIEYGGNVSRADEARRLFLDGDASSDMDYNNWKAIHRKLGAAMTRICEMGADLADAEGVEPGPMKYLWADAIADQLYASYH